MKGYQPSGHAKATPFNPYIPSLSLHCFYCYWSLHWDTVFYPYHLALASLASSLDMNISSGTMLRSHLAYKADSENMCKFSHGKASRLNF